MKQPLPIDALQADLVAACGRVRRLVLRAPTATFMWINRTTQTTLSVAPPLANLIERKQAVSIAGTVPVTMTAAPAGAATDAAIATLNASINALTRHIAVQNILTVEMLDNGRTDLRSLLNDPTVTTY
jgi:hypothetical protein